MSAKAVVHVVGTGTIGEPLIGLFCRFKKELAIEEVTFLERTPLLTDRSKVKSPRNIEAGLSANLATANSSSDPGMEPAYETIEVSIEGGEYRPPTGAEQEWSCDGTYEQLVSSKTPYSPYAAAAGLHGSSALRERSQSRTGSSHRSNHTAEDQPPHKSSGGRGPGFGNRPGPPQGVLIDNKLMLALSLAAGAHILFYGNSISFWQFLMLLGLAVISLNVRMDG